MRQNKELEQDDDSSSWHRALVRSIIVWWPALNTTSYALWLVAAAYALCLYAAAAFPFLYLRGHARVAASGVLACAIVWLAGLLFLARVTLVDLAPTSLTSLTIQAFAEELVRGICLYVVILRSPLRLDQTFKRSMLFGCAFGWTEFDVRTTAFFKLGACGALLQPLSCEAGLPLLAIGSAEPILFHIFISALNYRDASTPVKLSFAIIAGTLIHSALTTVKTRPNFTDDNIVAYATIPTLLIATYLVTFFLFVRTNRISLWSASDQAAES